MLAPQKKSQENINSRLALVMKSGKFTLGSKTSIKCLRSGKGEAPEAFLIALLPTAMELVAASTSAAWYCQLSLA